MKDLDPHRYGLSSDYGVDLDDLTTRAAEALYQAKRGGGGVVCCSLAVTDDRVQSQLGR